jgi:hypothetical protein
MRKVGRDRQAAPVDIGQLDRVALLIDGPHKLNRLTTTTTTAGRGKE